MAKKITRFLSLENAINDVFLDLAVPGKWYDLSLFAKVYGFLTNGEARPGIIHPGEIGREKRGIWFKSSGVETEEFISTFDFKELAIDLIPEVVSRRDEIAQVYEWTMWVDVAHGKGDDDKDGIWIETEMEKFQCTQCGNCCRDLSDAFQTTVDTEDITRWRSEGRWDILQWVEIYDFAGEEVFGDIWISPNTGDDVNRCPWLRKLPRQEKYKCRIQNTKPTHCRNYPKSKKHALTTGCKGFGDDLKFEMVKGELEELYGSAPL